MLSKHWKKICWLLIAGVVIALDQTTKFIAMMGLELNQPVSILPSLNMTYTQNKGIAFSMLSHSHDIMHFLVTFVAMGITGFLCVWLWRLPLSYLRAQAALALIIGGAVGNLLDRLLLGHVRDFVHFYLGDWHFAIFNVADVAISIGAFLMVLDIIFGCREEKVTESSNDNA